MMTLPASLLVLIAGGTGGLAEELQPVVGHCPVEVAGFQGRGEGGMAGNGWDGPGQNSTTILFHVENISNGLPAVDQRRAIFDALAAWAGVVQIHFVEIAAPNWNRSIDFRWAVGNHCAVENAECGNPNCPFDGPGGVLAHAGFPPGVNSVCVNPMPETFAGNVHFDADDPYERDNDGFGFSMTLIAAHEIGHAIGLTHDTSPGGPHIMRPSFSMDAGMQPPSASDVTHIRSGYRSGSGSVTTLEDSGIWVNSAWTGPENGRPGNPFNTVAEGVAGLPPGNGGVTIHVVGGLYPGAVTISQPCTITAEISTAFIGR